MLHIALHVLVPVVVAVVAYRKQWRLAAVILLATLLVDVDHLMADPVYDPQRCSIGFHPLHARPLLAAYAALMAIPGLWWWRQRGEGSEAPVAQRLHWVGLGLVIHMALDWGDCLL